MQPPIAALFTGPQRFVDLTLAVTLFCIPLFRAERPGKQGLLPRSLRALFTALAFSISKAGPHQSLGCQEPTLSVLAAFGSPNTCEGSLSVV